MRRYDFMLTGLQEVEQLLRTLDNDMPFTCSLETLLRC